MKTTVEAWHMRFDCGHLTMHVADPAPPAITLTPAVTSRAVQLSALLQGFTLPCDTPSPCVTGPLCLFLSLPLPLSLSPPASLSASLPLSVSLPLSLSLFRLTRTHGARGQRKRSGHAVQGSEGRLCRHVSSLLDSNAEAHAHTSVFTCVHIHANNKVHTTACMEFWGFALVCVRYMCFV